MPEYLSDADLEAANIVVSMLIEEGRLADASDMLDWLENNA